MPMNKDAAAARTITGQARASQFFDWSGSIIALDRLVHVVIFGLLFTVALLFGIYIPELFPTEVRLRAAGIVNTLGRGATIVTPFLVVMLFEARGVAGVMALMIGLLVVQIVAVWAFGIEPRHRSLEELKGEEAAPTLVKQAS